MAPPRKKRGVLARRREARLVKMIGGTLAQDFKEGLDVLGYCVTRLFAIYIAMREGQAVKEAQEIRNPCLRLGGKVMCYGDAVKGTDTHVAMKDRDPIVAATGRMTQLMRKKKYRFSEQVAVLGLALVSRSRSFVEAVEREVSELPNRPRGCLDVVAPDIVMMPLRAGSKLGTLEGGSVAPGRVLPNGKRKQPNLDAASWNVGRAAGDLVNFSAAGAKLFGKRVDARLVTHADVVALVKKTSCCNVIENHFVQTLRALGMFDETSEAGRVKSGTDANAFAQAFGAWQTHVAGVNAELRRLRCREIAVADLAINSCQVMNVFANFLFGANKSWRGKNVIQRAPKVTTYFAAKQRRARTRAKRRRAVRGMSCSVVVQWITGTRKWFRKQEGT